MQVSRWYDLAVAIGEIGLELGIINKIAKTNPIKTKNYPTPARRPKYSILDTQPLIFLRSNQIIGE